MANEQARTLRRNQTPQERKLWNRLRSMRAEGFHFRRQVPFGPYIADFVCHRVRLIIEVDAGQHGEDESIKRDNVRTGWFESRGYSVIRFWISDIVTDFESVMETIYAALEQAPTRSGAYTPAHPPRVGEG